MGSNIDGRRTIIVEIVIMLGLPHIEIQRMNTPGSSKYFKLITPFFNIITKLKSLCNV